MKYLRLANGATLPFFDILFTNTWIIKIRVEDASIKEIQDFFGKDSIDEIDLLDEDKTFIECKKINAQYSSLYLDTEKVVFKESRMVKPAQTVPVLDDDGNQIISTVTNEPLTTVIPEKTETIEKTENIEMIYVILSKPDLESAIETLRNKLGLVNPSQLTLEEYKAYYKSLIGGQCRDAIYAGCDIVVSENNNPVHFSFTNEDQLNIKNLYDTAKDTGFKFSLPYHKDGGLCILYPPADLLTIYVVMQSFITYHTTYCNILNQKVDAAGSIFEIKSVTYGMALSESEQQQIDALVNQVKTAFSTLIEICHG